MNNQWFLFSGENLYEMDMEKRRWLKNFAEKHGPENIVTLVGKSVRVPDLKDELAAAPFIAEKRLIVLEGMPMAEKDDVEGIVHAAHEKTIVLCVDPKPDKRFAATKAFLSEMKVTDFTLKSPDQLVAWLLRIAADASVTVPPVVASELVSLVGADQYMLSSEIGKLIAYVGKNGSIASEHVHALVVLSAERAVWQLMDLFSRGNANETIKYAAAILEKGETAYGLWSRILWMVSQLALVGAFVESGTTNPTAIAKEAGVPFLTAKSLLPLVRGAGKGAVSSVCAWFATVDVDLKTGKFKSTTEAPDELNALIDRGLIRLCGIAA